MRLNRYISIFILLLVALPLWAQDKVIVDVDFPTHIIAGQPFRVSFTANANAKSIQFTPPEGLEQLYGPSKGSSTSMRIVNGKRTTSSTTSFTYTFLAESEGTYVIPEATIIVGNTHYRTTPRRIKVFSTNTQTEAPVSAGQGISNKDLYIVAIPSKTKVYEQEAVQITYKLYSRLENTQFTNFSFPDFEGFVQYVQHDGSNTQFEAEEVSGKLYYTAEFYSVVLYPQQSGKLTIKPAEFEMVVNMPISNPQRSFFDSFFDNFEQVTKRLKTQPITIDVRPLPTPQPDGFSGAVGQYSLQAEVPNKVLKTNESFTYKLTLQGYGNIKLAQIPVPEIPEGFETFDPKEEEDTGVSEGDTRGTKIKEYYAVPRHTGDFTIPAVSFSYFDPSVEKYQKVSLPEVRVHVDRGARSETTTITGLANKEDVKYLGKDIRYLKSNVHHQSTLPKGQWHSPWLLYVVLVLLLIGAIVVDRTLEANNADTATNRSRKAGKTAQKYLRLAQRMLTKGESGAYYEALLKGISDYLSAKFHIPLSQLSKEHIREEMANRGVEETLIEDALSTLSALEIARYTPSEIEERQELFDRATEVIEGIQKMKLKK